MLSVLAAAPPPPDRNVFDIVTGVFSRADTLAHPRDLLPHLQALSVVWAVIFLVAGIVCLMNGYKFYKTVTVVLAMLIGLFTGYYLGKKIDAEFIVGGCLGALFAVGCWPLMKYSVAVMGGLAGAFLGANAWSAIARLMSHNSPAAAEAAASTYWVGALMGLIVCGMLAFILFKLSIVMFTSVSGATLAVLGAMALLLQVPPWRQPIAASVSTHAVVIPLLVLVPALIGLILQESKKEAGPGGGGGAKPAPKPAT